MEISNILKAKGQVTPSFIDIKTGASIPWDTRHNTLSYDASKAMAAAFGGDASLIPNRIGIIYGSDQSLPFRTITRDQTWSELGDDLHNTSADVQIQSFCATPSLKEVERTLSGGTIEKGYGITFTIHSDSTTEGYFGSSSSTDDKTATIFKTDNYIYQAVLLNKSEQDYKILARVSLDNKGTYLQKPKNFELALDWTVKFF